MNGRSASPTTRGQRAAPEPTPLSAHAEEFLTALDADLNISGALGHLFELIRESNRALDEQTLTPGQAAQLLADWQRLNRILALEPRGRGDSRGSARAGRGAPAGPRGEGVEAQRRVARRHRRARVGR